MLALALARRQTVGRRPYFLGGLGECDDGWWCLLLSNKSPSIFFGRPCNWWAMQKRRTLRSTSSPTMLQSVLVTWWKIIQKHGEAWGHGSVMIWTSCLDDWKNDSRSRGWRRSTATLWWCEIHGHGAGCNLADVHCPDAWFFCKHDQKYHIQKRQEGTNRQA